jgi:uncharacterized membrane protein
MRGDSVDLLTNSQEYLLSFVRVVRMLLESLGALWVVVGLFFAMSALISAHAHRRISSFTQIRLMFSRYLSLALEFQVASDILSTSISPTWQEIGRLAATAAIRTGLNYFLSREIQEFAATRWPEEPVGVRIRDPDQPDKA